MKQFETRVSRNFNDTLEAGLQNLLVRQVTVCHHPQLPFRGQ
jgi:hypothetical protein